MHKRNFKSAWHLKVAADKDARGNDGRIIGLNAGSHGRYVPSVGGLRRPGKISPPEAGLDSRVLMGGFLRVGID